MSIIDFCWQNKIESLVDQYNTRHDTSEKCKLVKLEQSLDKISKNQTFFDALESMSLKLQRRVSAIVKIIEFNTETSDEKLMAAIDYFKLSSGEVSHESPLGFLKEVENETVFSEGKLRVSLYKILLFVHMADAIKSGRLNLLCSYRYKAIHKYLIDEILWKTQHTTLLSRAGLSNFNDFNAVVGSLKQQLEQKYMVVNQHYLSVENPYLAIEQTGKIKLSTPKVDSDESEYISSILSKSGFVPILQIFSDVNQTAQFTSAFKHFSTKHKK